MINFRWQIQTEYEEYEMATFIALSKAERLLKKLKICSDCHAQFLPKISNTRCVDCYENYVKRASMYQKHGIIINDPNKY